MGKLGGRSMSSLEGSHKLFVSMYLSSSRAVWTHTKQARDVHMNDIQFHPVHPSADQVMFRKLDRRVAILYVMLVDVLLPLCVYGYFS